MSVSASFVEFQLSTSETSSEDKRKNEILEELLRRFVKDYP